MPSIGFGLGSSMGKLSAQDMGVPDYVKALSAGVSLGAKPAQLTEQLLGQTLQNKINTAKAQYAQRSEAANLAHTQAGTGLTNLNIEKLRNELAQQKQLENLLGGGSGNVGSSSGSGRPGYMTPHGFEGSLNGIPAESNYSNTGEDREAEDQVYQRILKANGLGSGASSIPLKEKVSQGVGSSISPSGNTPADRMKFIYDNYPQHRAGLKKMGYEPNKETFQQKMEREIATSNAKEKGKLEVDKSQKLLEQAKDLQLAGVDINGIHDILTGPDSLGTGITKTLIGKFGWGSEKLGSFNERALRLQTQMTKALSSRGGVGAAKIVASGKPSTWKSTSENLGITEAFAERIKNEFDLANKEYKGLTGKELPYTLPEYVHNIGKKIETNKTSPTNIVIEYVRDSSGRLVPKKG